MSQQLSHSAVTDNLGEKYQVLLDAFKRFPVSAWRAIVLVIAAVWLVKSLAALFWLVFPIPQVDEPTTLALPVKTQVSTQGRSVSFDSLAALSEVFGTASPIEEVKPAPLDPGDPSKIQQTSLRLKLHGVFASNDPALGSAIIADGSKQSLYGVNDEIEGNRGVKLVAVMETLVVLDNKGRRESLWLFSEDDPKGASVSRDKPKPRPTAPSSSRKRADNTAAIRRDQLPKNIGDVVRFSVHREGGKMVGYRIRPGRDRELFNQVGLQANDIVTTVNGIEVNDPKQIRSVYKAMKTATEAQLTVLRDGQVHSITISLDADA